MGKVKTVGVFCSIILLLNIVAYNACPDSKYQITYEYGYNAGYEAGQQEREEGYEYEPEVVLAQPIFQALIKSMRAKINFSGFDEAFRGGFFSGYKDGYYGYSKKRTRFE